MRGKKSLNKQFFAVFDFNLIAHWKPIDFIIELLMKSIILSAI